MTPNEQGFVQAWDLKNVRLEPLLIEKKMYKITTKSSAMLVKTACCKTMVKENGSMLSANN